MVVVGHWTLKDCAIAGIAANPDSASTKVPTIFLDMRSTPPAPRRVASYDWRQRCRRLMVLREYLWSGHAQICSSAKIFPGVSVRHLTELAVECLSCSRANLPIPVPFRAENH